MSFKSRSISQIARMICGNDDPGFFVYRSSSYLTRFFEDCDTDFQHDGSTRHTWVEHVLSEILNEPSPGPNMLPETFIRVVRVLMDPADAHNEGDDRPGALIELNTALSREGFEAFYGADRQCHVRHLATNTVGALQPNPHRPLSAAEIERRDRLDAYLDSASEDELIEEILLPMFRSLGFERITASTTRRSSTARTSGCGSRSQRDTFSTSVFRPNEGGSTRAESRRRATRTSLRSTTNC